MISIALIDDDYESLEKMKQAIANHKQLQSYALTMDSYTCPKDVQNKLQTYDIFFLDIDMPNLDGISLAKKIRELDSSTLIIFMTNKEDLIHDSLSVQPFYFIRKVKFEIDCEVLFLLLEKKIRAMKKYLHVSINGRKTNIYIKEILYIEAISHYILICTKDGEYKIKRNLSDIFKEIQQYHIIRVHRSYLVNMSHIQYIKAQNIKLKNNATIPIGRKYKEEAIVTYKRYILRC